MIKKMVRGLNAVPRRWEIKDWIYDYHTNLDLICFSLYLTVDSYKQIWTAIYILRRHNLEEHSTRLDNFKIGSCIHLLTAVNNLRCLIQNSKHSNKINDCVSGIFLKLP